MLLLVVVTLAFGVILLPFWGAVFWGVIIAILFAPLQRQLVRRMGQRRTWAAVTTLAIILLIVTPPLILIIGTLVQESSAVYENRAQFDAIRRCLLGRIAVRTLLLGMRLPERAGVSLRPYAARLRLWARLIIHAWVPTASGPSPSGSGCSCT